MSEKQCNVAWETLRTYCQNILIAAGLPESDAFIVADNLIDADLRGVGTHGVTRLNGYVQRIFSGGIHNKCEMKTLQEHPATLALDAGNCMGMLAGKYAMERSIEKARESGCCFTTVSGSNHYGVAAYYLTMATDAGMIAFTGSNANPTMAPWGSFVPYFGTNPIAFAAPTQKGEVILDMATSIVALGKVILAEKLGKDIPEGWMLTKEGLPTTNPTEGRAGSILPVGGPKGYGLAMFVDIFSGILGGAATSNQIPSPWQLELPQNVGHFFVVVDISKFVDLASFKDRMEQMSSEIKALPKNPDVDELFMPGEIEAICKEKTKANGIDVPAAVYQELKKLGEQFKIALTF